MYICEDVWQLIKSFVGFQKYYLIPANITKKKHQELSKYFSDKCFNQIYSILQEQVTFATKIVKVFIYMMDSMEWIQCGRINHQSLWDNFAIMIATQCEQKINDLHCNCESNDCEICFTRTILQTMSRQFYKQYSTRIKNI